MAKEHRNRFNIPLPNYIARCIPHLFITPHHALPHPGKPMRLLFDVSKRYTTTSTPVNMLTSTRFGTETKCLYGDTLT